MVLKGIKVGKPLGIFVVRNGYKYRLVSKVEDVSEDRVCVSLIEGRSRVFQFQDSDEIEFVYKEDDRIWIWKNVKGGLTELDGIKVHCLYSREEGISFNRRNAYRVNVSEEIYLDCVLKEMTVAEEDTINYKEIRCKGFIKNISENGVGILSNEVFQQDDLIKFQLPSNYGLLECVARVVRIDKKQEETYMYYYGCYLIKSDLNLIKYIYYLQRKQIETKRK